MKTCLIPDCGMKERTRGWCSKHYSRFIRWGHPLATAPKKTPSERFWEKVNKTSGCWLWTGSDDGRGYGNFNRGKHLGKIAYVKAHRFAYEELVGPIPEDLVLDHLCHTTRCVNPDHVRAVPQRVNSQNLQGLQRNNTSGYRGVSWHKATNKFRAYIMHNYKQIYLGLYDDPEEAAKVAASARAEHFDLPYTT